MRIIKPKIIDYRTNKEFQCLLSDIKVALNYLEQYNGKPFEDTDYLPPLSYNGTKMDWIKDYLNAALIHIKNFENKGIVFL